MASLLGVHLLPATGEFTYDTTPYLGQRSTGAWQPINTYYAPGGARTDCSYALDQLQSAHPECRTVGLVCAWFANSTLASACQIYPSTTYLGGAFQTAAGASEMWRVSGLTQASAVVPPLPTSEGAFVYGGTPSDASVVRCLRDLKARGFRVVFYPFLLMTAPGYPWRGRIGLPADLDAAATTAVSAFMGAAAPSQFTPDPVNLTVAYGGPADDFTYRRMILHYAWLCALAGGVDLFALGSELRGLETIRGPGWTRAGTLDAAGAATWDYPFVASLASLARDVRAVFDSQGLSKNSTSLKNLITYSADWSSWMGVQHAGAGGQWPHLDPLWASPDIDLVAFDNYLPLSDWTTGAGGLDAVNWQAAAPSGWPPAAGALNGLGLTGAPTIASLAYLKANIEGGEKFNWYYGDGVNLGRGFDPNGSSLQVSLPEGDRLAQARNAYSANQQILANKQFRWWWNNPHYAVYDNGDGSGWAPHGAATAWKPQSKSIAFLEYGCPAVDRGTNQPNVFFDAKSAESATPFWSIWESMSGGSYAPAADDTQADLALQAIYEYWNVDGHNAQNAAGAPLIQTLFCCAWCWDARPFPTFPDLAGVWGDAGNWSSGNWLNGRGAALAPLAAPASPLPGAYPSFPTLSALGWSIGVSTRFATQPAPRVNGAVKRRGSYAGANYEIELTYEGLRADPAQADMQTIAAFYMSCGGAASPFWFSPPGLAAVQGQTLGVGDGITLAFPLLRTFGAYAEAAPGVSSVSAVYWNGVLQAGASWSVSSGYGPRLLFASPPPAGTTVSADFQWLWLCRFRDDLIDFEEFEAMLFEMRSLRLATVWP